MGWSGIAELAVSNRSFEKADVSEEFPVRLQKSSCESPFERTSRLTFAELVSLKNQVFVGCFAGRTALFRLTSAALLTRQGNGAEGFSIVFEAVSEPEHLGGISDGLVVLHHPAIGEFAMGFESIERKRHPRHLSA